MIVRIRFARGRAVRRGPGPRNRHLALAAGSLLMPLALMAYVLGFWRVSADLGWTAAFPLAGLFSHWQVWIGAGAGLHIAARRLTRYAGPDAGQPGSGSTTHPAGQTFDGLARTTRVGERRGA